ncbi:hypothetical protein FHS98_003533 [Sphingomonas oligoaromativorans]|nr:hypothetical protein [Sphingomonas oligoaromativorans]
MAGPLQPGGESLEASMDRDLHVGFPGAGFLCGFGNAETVDMRVADRSGLLGRQGRQKRVDIHAR